MQKKIIAIGGGSSNIGAGSGDITTNIGAGSGGIKRSNEDEEVIPDGDGVTNRPNNDGITAKPGI